MYPAQGIRVNPVALVELSTDPTDVANTGFLYTNDVTGVTELFYDDPDGAEVQITSGAGLNGGAITGPIRIADGSAAAPAYSFSSAATHGFYWNAGLSQTLYSAGSVARIALDSEGVTVGSGGGYGWGPTVNDPTTRDLLLVREAAAVLQMGADVNGAAVAQTFKAHDGITGTDVAGANLTLAGGRGTGAGAVGNLLFATSTLLGSGTTAQTLTTRVTITGTTITTTLPLLGPNGTAAAPTYSFSSSGNSDTGAYLFGDGRYVVTVDSTPSFEVEANLILSPAAGAFAFLDNTIAAATTTDVFLRRDAANTLALRNGTTAQTLRIYNTFTDASNYERGDIRWAANILEIVTSGAGTGSTTRGLLLGTDGNGQISFAQSGSVRWAISTSQHLIAGSDNLYDIGASGATRPRTGYFGTSVNIGPEEATSFTGQLNVFRAGYAALICRDVTNNVEAFIQGGTTESYFGSGTNHPVVFMTNLAARWTIAAAGGFTSNANYRFAHGTSALATTATEGFFHVNSCAGTPTGVPASIPTGQIPMVFDTTGVKVWFYTGGSWKGVVVA